MIDIKKKKMKNLELNFVADNYYSSNSSTIL